MLADQRFKGTALVPAVVKVSRKILSLAAVLIKPDILMLSFDG